MLHPLQTYFLIIKHKKMKKVLLVLLVVFIAIQFFPTQKNVSTAQQPNNINNVYSVPADVDNILKTSCYDCHSNNTKYPWYNRTQPVAWFLAWHVKEGKQKLNFDEFATYADNKRAHKLDEVREVIQKGEMPLTSYTLIHTDAKLSDAQKQTLINWVNTLVPPEAEGGSAEDNHD